jgi:hypothetical protein
MSSTPEIFRPAQRGLESCVDAQLPTENGYTHLCITIRWAADTAEFARGTTRC